MIDIDMIILSARAVQFFMAILGDANGRIIHSLFFRRPCAPLHHARLIIVAFGARLRLRRRIRIISRRNREIGESARSRPPKIERAGGKTITPERIVSFIDRNGSRNRAYV